MKDLWNYVQSWFFHLYASLVTIRPATINWLIGWGKPNAAVELLEGKFDQLAPREERIASNEWYKKKWAFPKAAQFLVDCKPTAAAAVIHAYAGHPQKNFKATVLVELLLTLPPIADDPEKSAKAEEIASIVAKVNPGLIVKFLQESPSKAAFELISRVKDPVIFKSMRQVPVETCAYLLRKLRAEDSEFYEVFEGKLNAEYAEKIKTHWLREEFRNKGGRGGHHAPLPVEADEPEPERIESDAGKPPEEPPE